MLETSPVCASHTSPLDDRSLSLSLSRIAPSFSCSRQLSTLQSQHCSDSTGFATVKVCMEWMVFLRLREQSSCANTMGSAACAISGQRAKVARQASGGRTRGGSETMKLALSEKLAHTGKCINGSAATRVEGNDKLFFGAIVTTQR